MKELIAALREFVLNFAVISYAWKERYWLWCNPHPRICNLLSFRWWHRSPLAFHAIHCDDIDNSTMHSICSSPFVTKDILHSSFHQIISIIRNHITIDFSEKRTLTCGEMQPDIECTRFQWMGQRLTQSHPPPWTSACTRCWHWYLGAQSPRILTDAIPLLKAVLIIRFSSRKPCNTISRSRHTSTTRPLAMIRCTSTA
jgi:hypothetical protein